jgi:tetratricopeptide (TPR) repeat protein
LTRRDFWSDWAAECSLKPEDGALLQERIEKELLECHREQAQVCLVKSDVEGCREHLSCLRGWDQPAPMLYVAPAWAARLSAGDFCEERGRALAARSQEVFQAWVNDVLWRAKKHRDDEEARKQLPPGVSRDYEAACRIVEDALDAVPENDRLRMFYIEQCVDHVWELVGADQRDQAMNHLRKAIPKARAVANERFRPGALQGPDGQLVKRTFDYAWKLESDRTRRIGLLHEYLSWNGPDDEAEATLCMDRAQESREGGDFDAALEALESMPETRRNEEEYITLLTGCRVDRAVNAVIRGDEQARTWAETPSEFLGSPLAECVRRLDELAALYGRAERDIADVSCAHPEPTEIAEIREVVRDRVKTGTWAAVLKAAEAAWEQQRVEVYGRAAELLAEVPDGWQFTDRARQVRRLLIEAGRL